MLCLSYVLWETALKKQKINKACERRSATYYSALVQARRVVRGDTKTTRCGAWEFLLGLLEILTPPVHTLAYPGTSRIAIQQDGTEPQSNCRERTSSAQSGSCANPCKEGNRTAAVGGFSTADVGDSRTSCIMRTHGTSRK